MNLVAISAAYGTSGDRIGQAVAEGLDVPFIDRAIPMAVASRLEVPYDEAAAHDEQLSMLERIFRGFMGIDLGVPAALAPDSASPEDFRRATEHVLLRQAAIGEGVILGRGAVAVLRHDPYVLRVRVTGPPERRTLQAARRQGSDAATAGRAMRQLDRTHATYMRHLYGVNIDDPAMYHLMIDATAISTDACVEMIITAARSLAATGTATPGNRLS
jgi:hypothetical protein